MSELRKPKIQTPVTVSPADFPVGSPQSRAAMRAKLEFAGRGGHGPKQAIVWVEPHYDDESKEMKQSRYESKRAVAGGKLHLRLESETFEAFLDRVHTSEPQSNIITESPFVRDLESRIEVSPFPGTPEAEAMKTRTPEQMHTWRFEQEVNNPMWQ